MTYDNFTIKAQEAILQAQQISAGYEQQSVDTAHLLKGMLNADDSVTDFLLKKAGVNMARFEQDLDKLIWETPKVQGADKQYLTNEANKAVAAAKAILKDFGDEYISLELLLLGIAKGNDKTARLLRENGATLETLTAAVKELRKGRKITDQTTEQVYNALQKYAINLTEMAENGHVVDACVSIYVKLVLSHVFKDANRRTAVLAAHYFLQRYDVPLSGLALHEIGLGDLREPGQIEALKETITQMAKFATKRR